MNNIKLMAWLIKERLMCDVLEWYSNGRVGVSIQDSGPFLKQPEEIILMQFTGLKDKNGTDIFEGDIVLVLSDRRRMYGSENPKSTHDKRKIETRSVIVFYRFSWRLDTKTEFNNRITDFKGNETDERWLTIREDLFDYWYFQPSHPNSEWHREKCSHAYWSDIEVIGDIHSTPELLK